MPTGVYPRSPEHREKLRAIRIGRKHSPETRARMSASGGNRRTHGQTRSATWYSWASMIARCFYPANRDYHRYAGRGITVCDRWRDFSNFLSDMGERPEGRTLDRIDNDGNYEPGNCRWSTPKEQAANRRKPGR